MPPSRPNIVLITSDQHRGDTLGSAGHPCVRTAHLDILAHEGIRFDSAYVDCPVCIPARTTLVTGIQAHRYGKPNFAPQFRIDRDRERFLGSLMTRAGYQTHLVGKRHWHTDPTFRGGFEHVVPEDMIQRDRLRQCGHSGNPVGTGQNAFQPRLSAYPPELCFSNWAVSHACDFLKWRDRTQPFFLWVSTIDPHPPNVIHEPYYSMYDHEAVPEPVTPDWARDIDQLPYALATHRHGNGHPYMRPSEVRNARGVYYGMVTNMDDQLGRLFGTLMRQGVWEDTWIIYSSDHGDHLGDYGDWSKSTFLAPSCRVPLIVRPPKGEAQARGVVSNAIVQWADLLPTLTQIGDAQTPDDIDGASLVDLCREGRGSVRDELHTQIGRQHMLLHDRWKYLYFAEDGRQMLFDTVDDRLDEHDLSGREDLVAPMRKRLIDHLSAEGNADCQDGQLVNDHLEVTDEQRHHIAGWLGMSGPG